MEKEKKDKSQKSRKVDQMLMILNAKSEKEFYVPDTQINLVAKKEFGNSALFIRKIRSRGYHVGFWFSGKKWHTFEFFEKRVDADRFYSKLWEEGYSTNVRHKIYDYFFLSEDFQLGEGSSVFGRLKKNLRMLVQEGVIYIDELQYEKMKSMKNVGAKTWWLYGKLLHDGNLGHLLEKD